MLACAIYNRNNIFMRVTCRDSIHEELHAAPAHLRRIRELNRPSSDLAGFPSPADDYVENQLDVSEFLIDHAASTFFVTIKGDSMINVGLLPGDKVVVDRSKTTSIGDIVLAVVDRDSPSKSWITARTKCHNSPLAR